MARLVALLIGCATFVFFAFSSAFWLGLILLVEPLKLVWRRGFTRLQLELATAWVSGNNLGLDLSQRIEWDVGDLSSLDPTAWYVVVANHRSWVDVVAFQHTFNRLIPPVRFFLKRALLWVPLIGQACWALDMPFLRPRERPDARGLRRFHDRFRAHPSGVLVFVEATRLSAAKHQRQGSPYRHLLLPRPGAVAWVLDGMRGTVRTILDVTIAYPDGTPSFWDLLSRRIRRIVVRAEAVPVPELPTDEVALRQVVQELLNDRWKAKDDLLDELLGRENEGRGSSSSQVSG